MSALSKLKLKFVFYICVGCFANGFFTDVSQISSLISEKKIGLTQMNLSAVVEMSKRYINVKPILVLSQCMDLHKDWLREKFETYTYIKDSVEDLLVVKLDKHREEEEEETVINIVHFIKEILNEVCLKIYS